MANEPRPYAGGRLTGWVGGMDNRQPDYVLPADTLRDAVNTDILASGAVRRRKGISQRIADPGAHSLYSDGRYLYWATATALKRASTDFSSATVLSSPLLADPLSYTTLNGVTYFSNESINGSLTMAGVFEPWGVSPPATPPVATGAGGERMFQVTCTFVLATGEESGAPYASAALTSDDDQHILLTDIPQPSDARVTTVRIYATAIDGEVFYQHTDLPVGTTTYTLNIPYARGMSLRTQFRSVPPTGQLVESFDARLLIASGDVLWHTEPFSRGLVDYRQGYIQFSERITMLLAVDDGVFVSADQTYFLSGLGGASMELTPVLPYKAIEGAAARVPNSKSVVWFSERGFVIGGPDGQVSVPAESKIAVEQGARATLGVVERDGEMHFVAVFPDARDSSFAARDFLNARRDQIAEVR